MRGHLSAGLSVILTCLLVPSASGQETWRITNDSNDDFIFLLESADGIKIEYELKQRATSNLRLFEEPHNLKYWAAYENPASHRELEKINVREKINKGIRRVNQIISPVKLWGNTEFRTRNGARLYIAMDGFAYDQARYGAFLNQLKNSRWVGPGGWTLDLARERARRPQDRNETVLKNIQYVPGDKYFVVAEWYHDGASGEMVIMIDPRTEHKLLGNYKYLGRWQENAIEAMREGPQP